MQGNNIIKIKRKKGGDEVRLVPTSRIKSSRLESAEGSMYKTVILSKDQIYPAATHR